ncbi:MAG TPA: choice-of-anchor J domain-containing protein [Actinomycetales bacterium]|nr:choice-of-anchor J domain-containing protein [Actinomycetales bacterium]
MRWAPLAAVAATALSVSGLTAVSAVAAPQTPKPVKRDTQELSHKMRTLPITKAEKSALDKKAVKAQTMRRSLAATAAEASKTPPVGTVRTYYVLDDYNGGYIPADFTLRTVGSNIEVWVENDLSYPAGDCRNDSDVTTVTDAQTQALADEFDNNILPKESQYFSVAPDRDGTDAPVAPADDPNYYAGDGNKTLALISNVRDANFYAPSTPDGATYIAGFFSPTFNEAYNRNVMTIDSYDWAQRTGANPQPGTACGKTLAPRPRLYEGTFAHEYQHLLEYYADGDEGTWLNEGLSDYAQTIVGYVDTTLPPTDPTADSHITCFEGWYGSDSFPYCGAENSLTQWEDQGSASVLSDYGAAYAFLTYVQNHFGTKAISFLHRDKANGLASVQEMLNDMAPGLTSMDVVHDWAATMALDSWVDGGAKGLTRAEKKRFTASQLNASIDWSWPGSFDSPGAPPNGSDYVLATTSRPVGGKTMHSLDFKGATTYAPDPMEWTVDAKGHRGSGALYSGQGNELDRSMVFSASVPKRNATLKFMTKYDIEDTWDFGFVQVSTDGGKTYTSLSNASTTSDHDAAAEGRIVAQLPGLTGDGSTWHNETFDLSKYAGQDVLIAFRYMTDPAANGNGILPQPGWWIDNVKVGGTTISDGSSLDGARTMTQIVPTPVAGWAVQVVGWTLDGTRVYYDQVKLNKNFRGSLSLPQIRSQLGKADRIGVIVTVDDPTETANKYADYTLKINGVRQAGGR